MSERRRELDLSDGQHTMAQARAIIAERARARTQARINARKNPPPAPLLWRSRTSGRQAVVVRVLSSADSDMAEYVFGGDRRPRRASVRQFLTDFERVVVR